MEEHIIDGPDQSRSNGLAEALAWWEKKRLLYNVIVGLTGLPVLLVAANEVSILPQLLIACFIYALIANAFYSLGYLLESWNQYYLKNTIKFEAFRLPLYVIGLLFSAGLTLTISLAISNYAWF